MCILYRSPAAFISAWSQSRSHFFVMRPPKKNFLYYPLSSVFTYAKKSLEKFYERGKHFACFMEKTIALFYIPLHWYLKVCWSYIWCFARFGTISAFEIQVLGKSAIKCRGNFRTLQFASGIRRQKKNCQRLSTNLCTLRWEWLRHTLGFCQGLWFGLLTVETTCSTYILLFTYSTPEWMKRKIILVSLINIFLFFHVSLLQ